jgi:hypothetical protein
MRARCFRRLLLGVASMSQTSLVASDAVRAVTTMSTVRSTSAWVAPFPSGEMEQGRCGATSRAADTSWGYGGPYKRTSVDRRCISLRPRCPGTQEQHPLAPSPTG